MIGRLAVVAVLAASCSGDGSSAEPLPDLTLAPLVDGDSALELAAVRGPAVLNLWATWCAPCRQEMPAFQEVSTKRPDVRFVGINVRETDDALAFLDEVGVTYEQFVDDAGELTDALGVAALPITLVVDRSGAVTTEHLGPMSSEDLEEAIGEAER